MPVKPVDFCLLLSMTVPTLDTAKASKVIIPIIARTAPRAGNILFSGIIDNTATIMSTEVIPSITPDTALIMPSELVDCLATNTIAPTIPTKLRTANSPLIRSLVSIIEANLATPSSIPIVTAIRLNTLEPSPPPFPPNIPSLDLDEQSSIKAIIPAILHKNCSPFLSS